MPPGCAAPAYARNIYGVMYQYPEPAAASSPPEDLIWDENRCRADPPGTE